MKQGTTDGHHQTLASSIERSRFEVKAHVMESKLAACHVYYLIAIS